MYESKIRDARWIAYDLPGNAGWIAFLAGLILCAVKRPEITGNNAISAFLILDLLCAAAVPRWKPSAAQTTYPRRARLRKASC